MGFNKKKITSDPLISEIKETLENEEFEPVERKAIEWANIPIVSTGSTLLDLAISGGRIYQGGMPCCIMAEIHGPSGSGKTAILSEIAANAQSQGGDIMYQDPEARMDKEYARIYNMVLDKNNYHRPDTVEKVFDQVKKWKTEKKPKVLLTDSLAALSTDLELGPKGDKMGRRRAKMFSEGFRVHARTISEMLWVCSNQEREGDNGVVTPGGKAIAYYRSLGIRCRQVKRIELEKEFISKAMMVERKEKKNKAGEEKEEVKIKQSIGILSECYIGKSTVDDPYRTAPVYILFGYGIDNVRANLQFLKDMQGLTTYPCPNGKRYMGMDQAILATEERGLEEELKKQTIEMWNEGQELFRYNRKRKKVR